MSRAIDESELQVLFVGALCLQVLGDPSKECAEPQV